MRKHGQAVWSNREPHKTTAGLHEANETHTKPKQQRKSFTQPKRQTQTTIKNKAKRTTRPTKIDEYNQHFGNLRSCQMKQTRTTKNHDWAGWGKRKPHEHTTARHEANVHHRQLHQKKTATDQDRRIYIRNSRNQQPSRMKQTKTTGNRDQAGWSKRKT